MVGVEGRGLGSGRFGSRCPVGASRCTEEEIAAAERGRAHSPRYHLNHLHCRCPLSTAHGHRRGCFVHEACSAWLSRLGLAKSATHSETRRDATATGPRLAPHVVDTTATVATTQCSDGRAWSTRRRRQ